MKANSVFKNYRYKKATRKMLGKCLCGDIEFAIEIPTDPIKIYQCHCSLCKKQSGASANAATIIKAAQFQWLKKDTIKQWQKQTGFSAHFCANCGCPVPNALANKYYWIPVGLLELDTSLAVEVVANFCLSSKSSWHRIGLDNARLNSAHVNSRNAKANNFDELPSFKTILTLLS